MDHHANLRLCPRRSQARLPSQQRLGPADPPKLTVSLPAAWQEKRAALTLLAENLATGAESAQDEAMLQCCVAGLEWKDHAGSVCVHQDLLTPSTVADDAAFLALSAFAQAVPETSMLLGF